MNGLNRPKKSGILLEGTQSVISTQALIPLHDNSSNLGSDDKRFETVFYTKLNPQVQRFKYVHHYWVTVSNTDVPTTLFDDPSFGSSTFPANSTQLGDVIKVVAWIVISDFVGTLTLSLSHVRQSNSQKYNMIEIPVPSGTHGLCKLEIDVHILEGNYQDMAAMLCSNQSFPTLVRDVKANWDPTSINILNLEATFSDLSDQNVLTATMSYVTF